MSTSPKTLLNRAAALIGELNIAPYETCQVGVDHRGLRFQLTAVELVRVSKQLNVPRSKIKISECPDAFHVEFIVRGAVWQAVVLRDRQAEFLRSLGYEVAQLSSTRRAAIENKPALLTAK